MYVHRRKAGPAFPFGRTIKSVLGYKTRRESIKTSIFLILTTPKGSIPYAPHIGSQIPYLIFEPLDDSTLNLVLYYAVHDLQEQETRLKVTSVSIEVAEPHRLVVRIGYIDRDDPEEAEQLTPVTFKRG